MMEIYGPPNTVAGLIGFYQAQGIDARSRVPTKRVPGMVRVSRIGGMPSNRFQDHARLLVEVWDEDQEKSFNECRRLWGMVAAVEDQESLPGLVTHRIEPATMPLQFEDDNAPELDRHQFEVNAYVAMEPMEVA